MRCHNETTVCHFAGNIPYCSPVAGVFWQVGATVGLCRHVPRKLHVLRWYDQCAEACHQFTSTVAPSPAIVVRAVADAAVGAALPGSCRSTPLLPIQDVTDAARAFNMASTVAESLLLPSLTVSMVVRCHVVPLNVTVLKPVWA